MAQEMISPISFYSSESASSGTAGSRPADSTAKEDSFLTALDGARGNSEMPRVLDAPKRGNKEPFFPHKPMPYHAPDDRHRNLAETREASSTEDSGSTRPTAVNVKYAARNEDSDDDDSVSGDEGYAPSNPAQVRAQPPTDDRAGVLNKSYDGAAVSYPVRQVAKDSLDEKTKEDLQKKGLWNIPAMVVAQPSPKVLAMKAVIAAQRGGSIPVQKPIAQFMASLESELGVTPDRLVKALQSLPPGQLQMPPQQTMIQVVKNLGLKGQDQVKATELYSKMLAQMQKLGRQESVKAAPIVAGGVTGVTLDKLLQKQQSAEEVKLPPELQAKLTAIKNATSGQQGLTSLKPQSQTHGREGLLSFLKSSHESPTGNAAVAAKDLNVPAAKSQNLNLASQVSQEAAQDQSQNFNQSFGQSQGQNFGQQGQVWQTQANVAGKEQAPVKDQVKFDLKHDVAVKSNGATASPLVDTRGLQASMATNSQYAAPAAPVALGSVAGMDGRAHAAAVKHEAIQTIVNNAQMLAHKGGGEMHLTLKPEHLGEIQLKVAMDGNRVNLQMTTDRGDVKKLFEQGVHELRHGLAQHNLSMDKLEVNVGDRNTGSFQHRNPDYTAARDFSSQSQQNQNARREMMLGLSDLRSGNAPRGLKTGSAAREAQNVVRAHSAGSGRLNVVA